MVRLFVPFPLQHVGYEIFDIRKSFEYIDDGEQCLPCDIQHDQAKAISPKHVANFVHSLLFLEWGRDDFKNGLCLHCSFQIDPRPPDSSQSRPPAFSF